MALVNEAYYEEPIVPFDRGYDLKERIKPNRIVGAFGIVHADGYENVLFWKVDGYRNDKRHGVIEPGSQSTYGKYLFDSMFKGWNT